MAHSLPRDRKYRKMVIHAIRILERSRGWDHESKLKAISQMIQVCNDLAPYDTYKRVLDEALPSTRRKGDVMYTRNRFKVFRSGFKYIQSLTTHKPISTRNKK